jgi:hypothetical protein
VSVFLYQRKKLLEVELQSDFSAAGVDFHVMNSINAVFLFQALDHQDERKKLPPFTWNYWARNYCVRATTTTTILFQSKVSLKYQVRSSVVSSSSNPLLISCRRCDSCYSISVKRARELEKQQQTILNEKVLSRKTSTSKVKPAKPSTKVASRRGSEIMESGEAKTSSKPASRRVSEIVELKDAKTTSSKPASRKTSEIVESKDAKATSFFVVASTRCSSMSRLPAWPIFTCRTTTRFPLFSGAT